MDSTIVHLRTGPASALAHARTALGTPGLPGAPTATAPGSACACTGPPHGLYDGCPARGNRPPRSGRALQLRAHLDLLHQEPEALPDREVVGGPQLLLRPGAELARDALVLGLDL
eukprot:15461416-Alexandrium_andersonii.AAC.2